MKKLFAFALALVLMLSATSAFALTIGFSQIGQESDWRTANTDDIRSKLPAEGWDLLYDDAQQLQQNQINALRRFITLAVDYILFTAVTGEGWDEVLKEVNDAGIPLILIDRMPVQETLDQIEYAAAFGGDFVEEGRRMGYWTARYLESVGRGDEEVNVVLLEGTTGSAAAVDRTTGIVEAFDNYPNLKIVAQQTGNFTRAEGQAVMESWLKSIDKIDVLLAENDDMGLGAIDAIKAAGLVPGVDIIIVGCDAVKVAHEAVFAGEMNATIECNPLYSASVIKVIKGLEAGEVYGRDVMHPDESVYDAVGGIPSDESGELLSILVDQDILDTRQY